MFARPAVPATLRLGDPVTAPDGPLENVSLRARSAGTAGNGIKVTFDESALTESGEMQEDTIARTVLIRFIGDATTTDDLFALLNNSELVEMIGTWNATDTLRATDDEFEDAILTGGVNAGAGRATFWGPHFPDEPTTGTSGRVIPVGPAGAATFAFVIESGGSVKWTWESALFKALSGAERRASSVDLPAASYAGQVHLIDEDPRFVRNQLRRYAAQGAPFFLGLPFEEVLATGESDGPFVPVGETSMLDWAVPGTTVLIISEDEAEAHVGVIQLVTVDTIELDGDVPEGLCFEGARVMPAVAVYLDPEQGFIRYSNPDAVETWNLSAHGANLGYPTSDVPAFLRIVEYLNDDSPLFSMTIVAKTPGPAGNSIQVQLAGDSGGGVTIDDDGLSPVVAHYEDGVTTAGELVDALDAESFRVRMVGSYDRDAVLDASLNEFGPAPLENGALSGPGTFGKGVLLLTFDGRPIWDRGIDVSDEASDTVHSMAQRAPVGPLPVVFGTTDVPDDGRQLKYGNDVGPELQWLKAFFAYAHGRARSWWLPTFRHDLDAAAEGPQGATPVVGGTVDHAYRAQIIVDSEAGDFDLWFGRLYMLRVALADETEFYCQVMSATDNLDGTRTLVVEARSFPPSQGIAMISWMQLCRFEADELEVSFSGGTFSYDGVARGVQQ